MEERLAQLQRCMYQYSRAIYRSIKDLIDPYVDQEAQLEFRRAVLDACEQTMEGRPRGGSGGPARVPPRRTGRVRADDGAPREGSALLREPLASALPGHPPLL